MTQLLQEHHSSSTLQQLQKIDLVVQKSMEVRKAIENNTDAEKILENWLKFPGTKILNGDRKIKSKMFTKLSSWMERLTFDTLSFSHQTYQISLKILLAYLNIVDDTPNNLQLLGCVSLHLASKISESTIVSITSYIQSCMSIFDKEQFEMKQMEVYAALQFNIDTTASYTIWRILESEFTLPEHKSQLWEKLHLNFLQDVNNYKMNILKFATIMMMHLFNSRAQINLLQLLEISTQQKSKLLLLP